MTDAAIVSSAKDTVTTSTDSSTGMNIHHQNHHTTIFSERVARALAVRTDTLAMKTAFDALSQLQQQQQQLAQSSTGSSSTGVDSGSDSTLRELGRLIMSTTASGSHSGGGDGGMTSHNMMIDSRSVRMVMEYDALQQAMAVQESVGAMLQMVTQLHTNCTKIAEIAHAIQSSIHDTPSSSSSSSTDLPVDPGKNVNHKDSDDEYQIATLINDTIQQRNTIQAQVEALQLFVQQYNLSDHDVHLLEHYNTFDDNINREMDNTDGMAFLQALHRIRKIRTALQDKFGSNNDMLSMLGDGATGTLDAGTVTTTTTTALQLMEQLSTQQENAYERLYHWLQQLLQRNISSTSGGDSRVPVDDSTPGNASNDFVLYAVQTLKYMTAPYYYNHCIELMAAQRRTVVTRTFLIALTIGISAVGETEQPPIEMKSYDSVAYVGDMLAFAFKSFTLEADLTKNLLLYQSPFLSNSNDGGNDEDVDIDPNQSDESMYEQGANFGLGESSVTDEKYSISEERALSATDMLSISMSGIVRPLKSRILQVLTSLCRNDEGGTMNEDDDDDDDYAYDKYASSDQDDDGSQVRARVGQLYDICGLLLFYYTTISRSVLKLSASSTLSNATMTASSDPAMMNNSMNPLLNCIMECFIEATQGYEATIRVYCAMIDQIAILSGESIATLLQRLIVLLIQIRTNSPGYLDDVTEECPNATCQETLSMEWVAETVITTCFNIRTITIDDIITIKELFQITKRNSNIQFNTSRATKLDDIIIQKEKDFIDELVRVESVNVFDLCGLSTVVNGWNRYKKDIAVADSVTGSIGNPINISSYPGLSPHEIETSIREFYTSLYSPPIPSFETTIHDPITRKSIRGSIANVIVNFYDELYTAIQNDVASYDDSIRRLLQHSPQEVQTLFTV